jgi:hypothetical protein
METFQVQRKQCKTCIFTDHWQPEDLQRLLNQIKDPYMEGFFAGYRICHHSHTACCAGFWARHKDDFQLGQLAQRLRLVEYVDHDNTDSV